MARQLLNMIILAVTFSLTACSSTMYQHQNAFNCTKAALQVSSLNSAAVPIHPSGKVHLFMGLVAWGDASIHSAEVLYAGQDGTYKIQQFAIVEQQEHLLFGCGYYRIYVRGNIRQ
jgi:hypothetical protein